jgi:hypothetical protein
MKRIFLVSILLSLVCAANAQTTFSVPSPTLDEKYSLAKNFMYNNILTAVAVTKNAGMTAEELGKKCGEIYAPAWDAETGFNEFVNAVIYHYSCLSDNLQIIEQSKKKVVLIASPIYPILENRGVFFGTSIEELVVFLNSVYSEIANHFNLNCNMTWVEEGLKIVMTQ